MSPQDKEYRKTNGFGEEDGFFWTRLGCCMWDIQVDMSNVQEKIWAAT